MKFAMIFLLCCVAFVAAAPQLIYPGYVTAGGIGPLSRTLVTGPTVVNAAPYTVPYTTRLGLGGLYGTLW